MLYFTAHQTAIALLTGHRFFQEAVRTSLPPNAAWAISLPGGLAQALYSVTIAQSFSSCELACGTMPLRNRAVISAAARSMVATYVILAAILATPNASAYAREAVRLVTAVSTNVALSLPLTTARLAGPSADIPIGGARYRGDWSAMQAFSVYVLARLGSSISAFWLSRARWPAAPFAAPPPLPDGNATNVLIRLFRDLPPPIQSLAPDLDETSAAAILMTMSIGASIYAFMQFHRDATPPLWLARLCLAASIGSVMLGQTFRVMQEYAKSHADFSLQWQAVAPGFLANALAFAAIPEQLGRAEASRGNVPIRHRYQVIEAARFISGIMWYLWLSENQTLNFPPVARQLTLWVAASATLLAFSLPNADSRRAAVGATPMQEIANPFDVLNR